MPSSSILSFDLSSHSRLPAPRSAPRSAPLPAPLPRPLERIVDILLRAGASLRRGNKVDDELLQIRGLLESLPLPTDEFGLACNRLHNAARYARSGETGAANWELVTLRKSLSRLE